MPNTIIITRKESDIRADALVIGMFAHVTEVPLDSAVKIGEVVLKTASGSLVSLTNPSLTELGAYNLYGYRVRPLRAGDTFHVTVGFELSMTDKTVVANFLKDGKKIDAIKHVRTVTTVGLKDAKDYVDNFANFNEYATF